MRYILLMKWLGPLSLLALSLIACSEPETESSAAVPCRGSEVGQCAAPLCMRVEDEACTFCRCSDPLEDESIGYGWTNTTVSAQTLYNPQAIPPVPRGYSHAGP